MKTIMAVVALALAAGNVYGGNLRDPNSIAELLAAKPSPGYEKAWKQIVSYGGPSYRQAAEAVVTYIKAHFKDPDSAKAFIVYLPFYDSLAPKYKDWIIRFSCNAKNSFGGYVGSRLNVVFWKDGQIEPLGQADFENRGGNNN